MFCEGNGEAKVRKNRIPGRSGKRGENVRSGRAWTEGTAAPIRRTPKGMEHVRQLDKTFIITI